MSGRGKAAVAAAAALFVAGAGFTVVQVFGTPGSSGGTATASRSADETSGSPTVTTDPGGDPAATGRAFLTAWSRRDYDGMQKLVLDQSDDMQRVYAGLARRLKLGKVTVTPGSFDEQRNVLPYTATLDVAGHPWTYRGTVPLSRTSIGWRVAFTSQTVHPELSNGQTLTLASPSTAVKLLDRNGRDLAADDDLDANLLGEQGVSGLRRIVAGTRTVRPLRLVVQDAGSGETVSVLKEWKPAKAAAGVRTTISLPVQKAAEKALQIGRAHV